MTPQQRDHDADSKRHILCLSYYYAPMENPGTRRIRAFGRYLPQSGYQPVVLTTSSYGALENDVEQLIFRAPDLLDAGRWVARAFAHRNSGGPQSLGTIVTPDSFISRVLEQLLIPDIHVGWLPAAVARGKTLLQTKTFRAIFSSSPPTSSHLAGAPFAELPSAARADNVHPWFGSM